MSFRGYNITFRGSEHDECQDTSAVVIRDRYSISIVADGHGSHPRSRIGSKFAVEASIRILERYLSDYDSFLNMVSSDDDFDSVLDRIQNEIRVGWLHDVFIYDSQHPLSSDEDLKDYSDSAYEVFHRYGSTLVIGVLTEDFWFGIQVGDGILVTIDSDYNPNLVTSLIDEECDGKHSPSLSDEIVLFHHIYSRFIFSEPKILSIATASDGFYSNINTDPSKVVLLLVSHSSNSQLWYEYVCPYIYDRTKLGNKDDTSFSLIYRSGQSEDSYDFYQSYYVCKNDDYPFLSDPDESPMNTMRIVNRASMEQSKTNEVVWYYEGGYLITEKLSDGIPISDSDKCPLSKSDPYEDYQAICSHRHKIESSVVPIQLLLHLFNYSIGKEDQFTNDLDIVIARMTKAFSIFIE